MSGGHVGNGELLKCRSPKAKKEDLIVERILIKIRSSNTVEQELRHVSVAHRANVHVSISFRKCAVSNVFDVKYFNEQILYV